MSNSINYKTMNLFHEIKALQILDAKTDSNRVRYGLNPICNGKNTVKFKVEHEVADKMNHSIVKLGLNTVKHNKFTTVYGVIDNESVFGLNCSYEDAKTYVKAKRIINGPIFNGVWKLPPIHDTHIDCL